MRFIQAVSLIALVSIFGTACAHTQNTDCQATPEVLSGTSLSGLADFWFGDPDFQFAILAATNSRVAQGKFAFISNPNVLPKTVNTKGKERPNYVCIPDITEAQRLKNRFDIYLEAVHDMAVAEPSEIITNLDAAPESGPVTVVTWIRSDQVGWYPKKSGTTFNAGGDIWVTLAPHLREFCTRFGKENSSNPDRMILRVEQRLGLAPASSKTHLVEFEIADAGDGKSLFRPCGNPSTTSHTCNLGGPITCEAGDELCHARADFFYRQYYGSYGTERPVEFPWTSLGYTFDWAFGPVGLGGRFSFIQFGESEYIVPKGTPAKLVNIQTTEEYCGLAKK